MKSGAAASTRASLRAMSCSAGVPRVSDRTRGRAGRCPAVFPRSQAHQSPSVEEVADAVVRATAKTAGAFGNSAPATQAPAAAGSSEARPLDPAQRRTPDYTPPISAAGPLYRVLEGTIVDTVLTNRLDGAMAAPVNCLVTNALYSHTGRQVLVPAGARILGETKPVQAFGETRLAVSFHRLLMPDGRSYRLDEFIGPEPDWRCRTARQGQSALSVHVRRGCGRWPDQRPLADTSEAPDSAAATGTERLSSRAAWATRHLKPRCRS